MERLTGDASPHTTTPNCVSCSRILDHRFCVVLHLRDSGWVIEQTSRTDEQPLATW
jgi:predicted dithiol-disulfide oxidoreductase (DUF899 family)